MGSEHVPHHTWVAGTASASLSTGYMMSTTHVQPSAKLVTPPPPCHRHLMFVGTPNLTSELISHFPQKCYLCGKNLSDTSLVSWELCISLSIKWCSKISDIFLIFCYYVHHQTVKKLVHFKEMDGTNETWHEVAVDVWKHAKVVSVFENTSLQLQCLKTRWRNWKYCGVTSLWQKCNHSEKIWWCSQSLWHKCCTLFLKVE